MDPAWDELLTALCKRAGMYVLAPRFLGVDAYLSGFSHGRNDGVSKGFQEWFSYKFPVDGGYRNPVAAPQVLARHLFGVDHARDLDEPQNEAAIQTLCALYREYMESRMAG